MKPNQRVPKDKKKKECREAGVPMLPSVKRRGMQITSWVCVTVLGILLTIFLLLVIIGQDFLDAVSMAAAMAVMVLLASVVRALAKSAGVSRRLQWLLTAAIALCALAVFWLMAMVVIFLSRS